MPKKVGDLLENGTILSYPKCEYDSEGFADVTKYLPVEFDLCLLKIEGKQKKILGWMQTSSWDGLLFRYGYKVTHWKRKVDDY